MSSQAKSARDFCRGRVASRRTAVRNAARNAARNCIDRTARTAVFAFLTLVAGLAGPATAGPGHQHGAARLTVAVDGPTLTLELETPLESLVGFEHAPSNDRQNAQLREMAQRLRRGETLFVPSAAAACLQKRFEAASPVVEPGLFAAEGIPSAAAGAKPSTADRAGSGSTGPSEHADLEARWVFECAHPAQLRQVEVRLFDAFRGLLRIDAEVAGPRAQSASRLTRSQRIVRW